jgi:uncharacterized membrane protein
MRAMTNTTNTTNTTTNAAADVFDGQSVIAVSFEDDRGAYKALTLLGELDSQHRAAVREAVVVARGEDGQITVKDRVASSSLPGTAGGGLIGLLLGVIGGPIGMLVGGTYGLFVGSLFDVYDAGETETALGAIAETVKPGHPALLAVVDEQSTDVLDAAMTDLGGTVLRRPVVEVEAEIAAAEDAERKAKREARKELNRARRERNKAAVDAKLDELKSKLHHGQQTESAEADDAAAAPAGTAR